MMVHISTQVFWRKPTLPKIYHNNSLLSCNASILQCLHPCLAEYDFWPVWREVGFKSDSQKIKKFEFGEFLAFVVTFFAIKNNHYIQILGIVGVGEGDFRQKIQNFRLEVKPKFWEISKNFFFQYDQHHSVWIFFFENSQNCGFSPSLKF